jgi:A/G-specific adenine glycosylase
MLQQTQVKTVIPYYKHFLNDYPDITRLADSQLQKVLKNWEGLGYYARARNFHLAAIKVAKNYNGRVPDEYETLRKLPGIGDYIASAILSIAFGRPYAVVDGNVKRVLARVMMIDQPVNKPVSHPLFKTHAERHLDKINPGTFNQAMMELGALVCTPKKPACNTCPVNISCRAFKKNVTDLYPKRIKSRKTPEYHIAVGVVFKNDRVLITQRKPDGLLGGLWEFPGGKLKKNETAQNACIREIKEEVNLEVKIGSFLKEVKHAYTHFKIVMDVFACRFVSGRVHLRGPVDFKWIKLSEIDRFPLPKANLKFLPQLLKLKK